MKLRTYNLTEAGGITSQESSEMNPEWFTDDVVRWIDVTASDTADFERLLEPLELHGRVRAASMATDARAEVIGFDQSLFLRLPFLDGDGEIRSLRIICGRTAIVTAHTVSVAEIDELAADLEAGAKKVDPSVAELLLDIIEAILREARPAAVALRKEINELSDTLEERAGEITIGEIVALKRRSSALAGLMEDQLLCLGQLTTIRSVSLNLSEVKDDLRALSGFLEQVRPIVLRLDEQARELRQGYAAMLQESTNRRLNVLAVLSAIYLPSTLVAGIYGMNFDDIPIADTPGGYWIVLSLMIALVVGQLAFFWHRGWFR